MHIVSYHCILCILYWAQVIGPKGKTVQTLIETYGVTTINLADDGNVQVLWHYALCVMYYALCVMHNGLWITDYTLSSYRDPLRVHPTHTAIAAALLHYDNVNTLGQSALKQ